MLEVSTPLLAETTVTDPHIQSFEVGGATSSLYLQTSPEFAMKKLLAKGSGPIYSLGSVFRVGEFGALHRPEFAMLEWYRPGYSLGDLQREVTDLIQRLTSDGHREFKAPITVTYSRLFQQHFGLNPHLASIAELRAQVIQHFPDYLEHIDHQDPGEKDDLLEVLFSQKVQPTLVEPHFVTEFPESLASLARVSKADGQSVALRVELYWQGLELANGYDELRDAAELKQRIERDNTIRKSRDLPTIDPDSELLKSIELMPACAGIAMGVDRLLMVLTGAHRIDDVL